LKTGDNSCIVKLRLIHASCKGLVGVTTEHTPGTNESLTTIEYFHLKVANSNWGIVVKLIVERKPSSKQAVMHYFLH
jgi:hypothetical protein